MATRNLSDASGAIATGGVAQEACEANESRTYLLIQNVSAYDMWVDFGATAVANSPSIRLPATAAIVFEGTVVPSDAVSIYCATTGAKYVLKQA